MKKFLIVLLFSIVVSCGVSYANETVYLINPIEITMEGTILKVYSIEIASKRFNDHFAFIEPSDKTIYGERLQIPYTSILLIGKGSSCIIRKQEVIAK